eukprot:TRINITY_DN4841_c0_g1_i1.p1 TRINITY_DN4841_c0_g1~~TRINITY_DN4841_c0_g1_i1.p1  ORF type:complete len:305 (-),score=64.00 TRINITY_DN4841_c0_g1_i1:280-1194(-)
MLWVDKYRPTSLEKMELHEELNGRLKLLAQSGDFPHLLFYGPPGAGKKTRITGFLRELYGSSVEKLKVEHKSFKLPSKGELELTTVASAHHIEMTPSDAGIHDRLIVQEVIKEIASSQPIDSATTHKSFKVIVLNEVERLTREAQAALRRTMEKYSATCRLLLCTTSTAKIIDPVKSRCLMIRVPAPTNDQISSVIEKVSKKEGITLNPSITKGILDMSGRNLRRALLTLEATKVKQYPFQANQKVELPDWEYFIDELAKQICEEQSPKCLLAVRQKLYELLTHCIPPDVIIKKIDIGTCQEAR